MIQKLKKILMENAVKILVAVVISLIYFSLSSSVYAATLYLFPSSGSYTVGKTFSLSIYVSSPDQAENADQATINFPPEKIEVVSFSKSGSILTLWVSEPTYSNTDGVIRFAGIIPNPGFTGQSGKLLTILFRVKDSGNAHISITKGSVLANDGQGTQILTGVSSADLTLELGGVVGPREATTPTGVAGTPLAPQISSPTHPNPDGWYNNTNPKFAWQSPNDTTAVRLSYGRNSDSRPTVLYEPPISEKQLNNVEDGVWYFNVQLKNGSGWGEISHFRFQIDTQPPDPFVIKFIDGKETDNPQPTVLFDSTDSLSGIEYYRIKIGEGGFFTVSSNQIVKSNPYTLPLQAPGKRSILVQALDKAGNYTVATEEFVIKPIEPPAITDYPQELKEGDSLVIKGKSYPEVIVTIYLQRNENAKVEIESVKSDDKGNFTLTWDKKLSSDIYKFWADVTDKRGAKSNPTDVFVLQVKQGALLRIGFLVLSYVSVIITLIVIVGALTFSAWYLWHKFKHFKIDLSKEVSEAERTLHSAFGVLRKNIIYHIRLLEKVRARRVLTKEEGEIMAKCKEDLDHAEKIIGKEIKDIEGDIGK